MWNNYHVLFMKNLFLGDENTSQNQLILSFRQVVTRALKGEKRAVELKAVRDERIM